MRTTLLTMIVACMIFTVLPSRAQNVDCVDAMVVGSTNSADLFACLKQMKAAIVALQSAQKTAPDANSVKAAFEADPAAMALLEGPEGDKGEPGKDGVGARIPDGLVIASTKRCSDLKGGWVSYAPGAGRFIIGVGSTTDERGQTRAFSRDNPTGGAFNHKLTITEMPTHRHDAPGTGNFITTYQDGQEGDVVARGGPWGGQRTTQFSGGGDAHNNMPPYIALYYCRKEG